MGNEVAGWWRPWGELLWVDGALGSLLRRQGEGALEELEERSLACVPGANDENTKLGLVI